MIKIVLGAVGSGKTAFAVREIVQNLTNRTTYSNIQMDVKNQIDISPDMIVHKEIVDYKKNKKSDEKEPVYKFSLNVEYWKAIKEPINVVLDEAHTPSDSRQDTFSYLESANIPTYVYAFSLHTKGIFNSFIKFFNQ